MQVDVVILIGKVLVVISATGSCIQVELKSWIAEGISDIKPTVGKGGTLAIWSGVDVVIVPAHDADENFDWRLRKDPGPGRLSAGCYRHGRS